MEGFKLQADPAAAERVAVIAIHGVADQKAGETARAVASLLINTGDPAIRYGQGQCDAVLMATPTVPPLVAHPPPEADRLRQVLVGDLGGPVTAQTVESPPVPPLKKALRQAAQSDFQRPGWTAVTGLNESAPARRQAFVETDSRSGPPTNAPQDLGIAFSDYLLFKAQRSGAVGESYEAARIQLTRTDQASPHGQKVDVFEMYWADLSRMSGNVPRIVGEIFTMMFRFSRLGRDAVDYAAGQHKDDGSPKAGQWGQLARLQRVLDLALSQVLSNLVLQLLVLGMMIALLGVAAPYAGTVASVVIWSQALILFWWCCYRYAESMAGRLLAALATAAAVYGLHVLVPAHVVVGLAWLAALAGLCDWGLRIAETRFPAVRFAGLLCMAGVAMALLGHVAANLLEKGGPAGLPLWVDAALRVFEYVLILIVAWWLVAPFFMVRWLIAGQAVMAGSGERQRASVITGRLGMFLSLVLFISVWMALWALLTTIVENGATGLSYAPQIFTGASAVMPAQDFMHDRYLKSTEAFSLVAALALVLLGYLVVMLLPSVLAEIKAGMGTSSTLGRWLSGGYRRLGALVSFLVTMAVAFACAVGIVMLLARFGAAPDFLTRDVAHLSETILKPLVLAAASFTALLSAFGGVLSRYLPGLRLPLDVMLDVDNHFREFPRKAIPRARIFARYVALLEHIAAQGYDRVVIVAHSQGSMITAELLRYLQYRARQPGVPGAQTDRIRLLWGKLEGRIDLMTAGCPLRQLYAERFPELYAWAAGDGPVPGDVGVSRWINLYATGDYVGRWLWTPAVYEASTVAPSYGITRSDVCLGSGAHTHYFDQDQRLLARWLDTLIRGEVQAPAPP